MFRIRPLLKVRLRFSARFRTLLAEKLLDLGNLALAALVFGQFVGGQEFSVERFVAGLTVMVMCYLVSYMLQSN